MQRECVRWFYKIKDDITNWKKKRILIKSSNNILYSNNYIFYILSTTRFLGNFVRHSLVQFDRGSFIEKASLGKCPCKKEESVGTFLHGAFQLQTSFLQGHFPKEAFSINPLRTDCTKLCLTKLPKNLVVDSM